MILDPDYGRVFTQARIIAWQYGYACVAHGSYTRDLDLLLVPWEERASGNDEQLLKLIADACGLRFRDGVEPVYKAVPDWTEKPHGRKSCSLFFKEAKDRRWVDISIMPPRPKADVAGEQSNRPSRERYEEMIAETEGLDGNLPSGALVPQGAKTLTQAIEEHLDATVPLGVPVAEKTSGGEATDSLLTHTNGPAKCDECQHKWIAVWPLAAEPLKCPKCGGTDTERQAT